MSAYNEPDTVLTIIHNINSFNTTILWGRYILLSLFPDKEYLQMLKQMGHLFLLVQREIKQEEFTFLPPTPLVSIAEGKKKWLDISPGVPLLWPALLGS